MRLTTQNQNAEQSPPGIVSIDLVKNQSPLGITAKPIKRQS
jgi:hypothetical protein